MRDYTLYLKDILAAIENIESFIAGMDQYTFHTDDKTTSAIVRKLEIIGENDNNYSVFQNKFCIIKRIANKPKPIPINHLMILLLSPFPKSSLCWGIEMLSFLN